MRRRDKSEHPRPWVDWTATQIHDPVWRLRYLQSVVPPTDARPRAFQGKLRKTIGLLTVVVLTCVIAPLSMRRLGAANTGSHAEPTPPNLPPVYRLEPAPVPSADVWSVEKASDFEVYSNGLRIENQYAVSHRPRAYVAFTRENPEATRGVRRTDPAGIVYHTTESLQAPFDATQNNVLKRVGESLLDYVRRRRCYNFLIDRFGRVYRIVKESDAADHAGHSVWADDRYFYVNLNDSFIGISFEAQTGGGDARTSVGNAQVLAAGMLTEMLRSRYKIPGQNCVTHAQVSVNPSNMQIGYHVDWASSFPFERLGLPDNYATPSPAVSLFGFGYDASFEQRAGIRLAAGALAADRGLSERAKSAHMSLAAYRKALHTHYLKVMASVRG